METAVLRKVLGLNDDADEEAVTKTLEERGVKGSLFLQEDVNAFIADDKKRVRKENEELRKELDASRRGHEDLSHRIDALLEHASGTATDDDGAGAGAVAGADGGKPPATAGGPDRQLMARIQRMERQFAAKDKELEEARKRAEDAERRSRIRERDVLLMSAGGELDFIDSEDTVRYFANRMEYDEDKKSWFFLDDSGLPAESVRAGIKESVAKRPYLLRPRNTGGAGAGAPAADAPMDQLQKEHAATLARLKDDPKNPNLLQQALVLAGKMKQQKQGGAARK